MRIVRKICPGLNQQNCKNVHMTKNCILFIVRISSDNNKINCKVVLIIEETTLHFKERLMCIILNNYCLLSVQNVSVRGSWRLRSFTITFCCQPFSPLKPKAPSFLHSGSSGCGLKDSCGYLCLQITQLIYAVIGSVTFL